MQMDAEMLQTRADCDIARHHAKSAAATTGNDRAPLLRTSVLKAIRGSGMFPWV